MKTALSTLLLVCVLISVTFASPAPDHTTAINRIVVFGDSLSDTGNDYQFSYLFRDIIKRVPSLGKEFPYGLIPSPYNSPYFDGRFSDGKNWFEDFANLFHIKDTERHHFGPLENFAYGGAWASPYINQGKLGITLFPLNLGEQVLQYQVEHPLPYVFNQHVLAVIFIGANDYLDTNTVTPPAVQVTHVVNSITHAIKALHRLHRIAHFLVVGMPDLADTPYAAHLPQHEKTLLLNLSLLHNASLKKAIQKLNQSNSTSMHVDFIDWLSDHQQLNDHFKQYHFDYGQNAPCHDFYPAAAPFSIPMAPKTLFTRLMHYNTPQLNRFQLSTIPPYPTNVPQQLIDAKHCDDNTPSSSHIYMDDVHPTRLAQCIIAVRACQKIASRYTWMDASGQAHPLNCGIPTTGNLQNAADACLKALHTGALREDTLLPFE